MNASGTLNTFLLSEKLLASYGYPGHLTTKAHSRSLIDLLSTSSLVGYLSTLFSRLLWAIS